MKKAILFAAWLIFAGCSKQATIPDGDVSTKVIPTPPYLTTETAIATVSYFGDYEIDGFGWVLKTGKSTFLKPVEMPESYAVEGLRVIVTYIQTEQIFPCRCNEKIQMIQIVSIEIFE